MEAKFNEELEVQFLKDNKIHIEWSVVRWALKLAFQMEKKVFMIYAALTLAAAVLPAVFLAVLQRIVDSIQNNVSEGLGVHSILILLIALVATMFIKSAFFRIPEVLWNDLDAKYKVCMEKKMCEFMKKVPVSYYDDAYTSKLMSLAVEEKNLGQFIACFFDSLGNILGFASMAVLAWHTSPWLLLVVVVFVGIMIPLCIHVAKRNWKAWTDVSEHFRREDYYYSRIFKEGTAKEVRLLNMKNYLVEKWRKENEVLRNNNIEQNKRMNTVWKGMEIGVASTQFFMLFVGLFLLQKGNMTLGGLTVFVSVFSQLCNEASNFGFGFLQAYRRVCGLKFVKMMFESFGDGIALEAKKAGANEEKDQVVFEGRDISFAYKEGKNVLNHLTFQIKKGETVALVGENGAGKSSLVKLLLGLYEPNSGELLFKGTNYKELDTSRLVESIGVTFQDFVKFELMIRENVSFGDIEKVDKDEKIHEAIEMGGAAHIVERMPKNIDTYLGRWYEKDGVRMSGGEWQRIAVSRSYINSKDILIMDEPAAALDPIAEMEQFNRIKERSLNQVTSILISHRIGFARLADKIMVLKEGNLVEYGNHEQLMAQKGEYYEMFTNQSSWYQG